MTAVMIGQNFKYEIEAVLKLFFPIRSFNFIFLRDGEPLPEIFGDRIVLSRRIYSGCAELCSYAEISGESVSLKNMLRVDTPDFEHSCEFALCELAFDSLSRLTGITPAWGILTGVRPVKLINKLKAAGLGDREIEERLKKKCRVSEEKIKLALETAKTREGAVSALPKNGFSLYVSIPFCPSRCAYCSFVSQTVESFKRLIPEYAEKLCEEISVTAELISGLGLRLDTVYFGGGTPTSLEPQTLDMIMKKIASSFDLSGIREYTVEAGRPDTVTEEKLYTIKQNGGNRVSVNPQTLNPAVLETIGRKHTVEQFYEAFALAKKAGFSAVNVDLIAGLPRDGLESFKASLDGVIALSPENITVHALSVKRSSDLMHAENFKLGSAEAAEMTAYSSRALFKAGYRPYYLYRQKNQAGNQENVGWEKGGTVGIYNVNMMEDIQTVIAVGAGGSTKTVAGEAKIDRFYNPKYPLEYIKKFDETVIARKKEATKRLSEIIKEGDGK